MPFEFPPHRRPNESRLEQARGAIATCRRLGWPYRRIARWLAEERQVRVSHTSIRKFCLVRGIVKGVGETVLPPVESNDGVAVDGTLSGASPEPPPKFSFDPEQPLHTRRNST